MSFKRSSLRYGHTEGFTYCGYSETGEHFLSCGPDGDLRTWASIDDDDPSSKCMGEFATSLLQIGDRLLVGADLNTVQCYTYPDLGRDGIEFRFTAMVTSIKANKTFLAGSSDDMMIKAVRLDKSEEVFELVGHEGPILQIDLGENMSSKYLASSSGDGTIKIWDLIEKKAFKTIEGLPKVNSFDGAKVLSTPTFERKTGKLFAYPLHKEIIVMDTVNWSVLFRLVDKTVTSDYSVCSFSPCGQYMAAGTVGGEFSLWNVKSSCPIRELTSGADTYPITSLAWNPTGNREVVYADSAGQIGLVRLVLDSEPDDNDVDGVEEDVDDIYNNIDFQDDDAEEDNENCVSLSKLKRETFKSEIDGDGDVERPGSAMSSVGAAPPAAKVFPMQDAFQPSATPESNGSQYFAWNNVGIICLHTVDDNISVDFHDASVHHAIHMKNYFNYTMGGLSKNVVALAGGRKLTGITFKAFGSKEWSVEMNELEEIVALAASDKLVAAATDSRLLRLFSTMGTQREVVSIPGQIVAIAAYDDKVMVAYHNGPASEDQHLSLMLVQAIGYNLRCRDIKLPLSPTAKLTWLGYTDRGAPVTFDSQGVLRLYGSKSNMWFPICETTQYLKGASDRYYIVDVSEPHQICRAVMCRGKPHPSVVPKPIVTPLKLEVPLCELQSEKGGLEEELVRYSILNVDDAEKMFKERALKLFAAACRTEAEFRARDLVEIIATPQFVELAVRYATKLGRIHLSERIMEMLPNIEEQEKENEKMLKASEDSLLMNTSLNTSSILLSTRERLSKTPVVVPKPMLISQQKRNPFKKSNHVSSTVSDKASPLAHLTEKAVGFADEQDSQVLATPLNVSSSNAVPDSLENVRNNKTSEQSPKPSFMLWFKENRPALEAEFPDADIPELTRTATKRYRSLPKEGGSTGKRKMEEVEKNETGVSKLAKFGFVTE